MIFQSIHKEIKMNRTVKYLAAATLISAFGSTSVLANSPSAKFAATYTTKPALASVVEIAYTSTDYAPPVEKKEGYTLATIKVPQDKELLVGVSAEIGLVTYGSVKGKNGGSGIAVADAEAYVNVFAVPKAGGAAATAAPGQIMLTKRIQELSATLGGVIQSCTDTVDPTTGVVDGTIDIATECLVTDEEIGLLQDTTAAHHFNFVLPNLPQGEYDIKAVFTTGARAEVKICDDGDNWCLYDPEGTVSVAATAKAVINKTMLTVQQVRATQNGIIESEIIE